jgi:hypothetical protein
MATPLGATFVLEFIIVAVLSHLHPGSPGETLDPTWDQAMAALMRCLPLGALPWMFRRLEGPVE